MSNAIVTNDFPTIGSDWKDNFNWNFINWSYIVKIHNGIFKNCAMLPAQKDSGTFKRNEYVPILPYDRTKCVFITDIITLQCIAVFVGSTSILICTWTPDKTTADYDKLARIMYLFDSEACGYKLQNMPQIDNLNLSNDTKGFVDIHPILWKRAFSYVSTRLTAKARWHIQVSLFFHSIWFLIAIVTRIFCKKCVSPNILKIDLGIFYYSCIWMLMFDISMGLVYISHIKQSLTKNMILRYSGWSSTLKIKSGEDFGGWFPLAASCCWMRGFILLFVNIYCARSVNKIIKKIKRREIKQKYVNEFFTAIPEPKPVYYSYLSNVIVIEAKRH